MKTMSVCFTYRLFGQSHDFVECYRKYVEFAPGKRWYESNGVVNEEEPVTERGKRKQTQMHKGNVWA
jgi:glycine/serine hydroxymethyltransferase